MMDKTMQLSNLQLLGSTLFFIGSGIFLYIAVSNHRILLESHTKAATAEPVTDNL